MSRLNTITDNDELEATINLYSSGSSDEGDEAQYRLRTERSEADWKEIPDDHLFNQEKYNYRTGYAYLKDNYGEIVTSDGEGIAKDKAKELYKLVRKVYRTKKPITIPHCDNEGNDNEYGGYKVTIKANGGIRIGCVSLTWDDVQAWAKRLKLS